MELVFEECPGKIKDLVGGFALFFGQEGFGVGLGFLKANPVFIGQVANSFAEVVALVLHDELDGIATFSASKTLIDVASRGNREGRSLFVVERAEADHVA